MKPIIPKELVLFGETIKVKLVNKIHKDNRQGEWDPNKNLIKLAKKDNLGEPRSIETIEQTYYHELVHAITESIGYMKLSENEHLVDLIGKCLHQISKTSKF